MSNISDKNNIEMSNISNIDDIDDYVIPGSYWNSIYEDINQQDLLKGPVFYMSRIYLQKEELYVYKVGFTENFRKRLKEHEIEYKCCGRIVPILLVRYAHQHKERLIHNLFKDISTSIKVGFKKHKELYQISPENYDLVKEQFLAIRIKKCKTKECNTDKLCSHCSKYFWESENYIIDIKRDKEDIDNANKKLPFFEMYNDVYISQNEKEDDFWHDLIYNKYYINYYLKSFEIFINHLLATSNINPIL